MGGKWGKVELGPQMRGGSTSLRLEKHFEKRRGKKKERRGVWAFLLREKQISTDAGAGIMGKPGERIKEESIQGIRGLRRTLLRGEGKERKRDLLGFCVKRKGSGRVKH